jgi:hypothetical protein
MIIAFGLEAANTMVTRPNGNRAIITKGHLKSNVELSSIHRYSGHETTIYASIQYLLIEKHISREQTHI